MNDKISKMIRRYRTAKRKSK